MAGSRTKSVCTAADSPTQLTGRAFGVRVHPARGLSLAAERRFEQGLSNYLNERDLSNDLAPLRLVVRCETRELGKMDQVDLLCWLFDDASVCRVDIGPLVEDPGAAGGQGAWVTASCSDLALPAVLSLYRLGRLDAASALKVLRGSLPGQESLP